MKTHRITTPLFTAICVFASLWGLAQQNPRWSLPSKYVNVSLGTSALPTASPGYGNTYSGNPHNLMSDNGVPLFYTVDGVTYNANGYKISGTKSLVGGTGTTQYGNTEVCYVPDPSDCNKYYIFSSLTVNNPSAITNNTCSMPVYHTPVYQQIDMHLQDTTSGVPTNPAQYGKNVTSGLSSGYTAKDLFLATSTPHAITDLGTICAPFYGDIHYAASKVRSDGSRLLFVTTNFELILYQLPSTGGINYVTSYDYEELADTAATGSPGASYGGVTQSGVTSELEIYEDATNNRIKVAFDVLSGGDSSATITEGRIALVTFPYTFANAAAFKPYTSDLIKLSNCHVSPSSANVSGIEFSPDGNTVYVVHGQSDCNSNYVEAYSFSSPSTAPTVFSPSGISDFENSQIELGNDGNMYLLGNGGTSSQRFAKISSPNSPGSSVFTDGIFSGSLPSTYFGTYSRYYIPDQIDQETYGSQYTASTSCCLFYNSYDRFNYNTADPEATYSGGTSSSQVWTTNTTSGSYQNNPLTNTTSDSITIGKELRIAAGYTVTIRGMKLKFSPQASLIIEGANGSTAAGVLNLRNCTLNVDNRCESKLWPGIRIWGDNTAVRSLTNQGYVNIDSTCVIENAWIGIETGYKTTDHQYVDGVCPLPPDTTKTGGGNVYVNNSSFINNQRDIYFTDYTAGTGGVCNIFNSTFTTNAYLLGGGATVKPLYHIQFTGFRPIANIKGCTFSITSSLTSYTGYAFSSQGINSLNSNYVVDENGTTRCKFSNFLYGIYGLNTSGHTENISVKNSSFYDNKVGTYMGLMPNGTFQSDTVKIYNYASGNYSGLYLDNCHGYKVQFNYFTKGSGTWSNNRFGNVVYNSGAYVNCIFSNTYNNLYKGIQPQYRNYISNYVGGNPKNSGGGLIILCNTFTPNTITNGDIYIPQTGAAQNVGATYTGTDSAGINYSQGTGSSYPITGGNYFSHTSGGSAYDFYIDSAGKAFNSNYVYYCVSSCPVVTSYEYPAKRKNVLAANPSATDVNCSTDPYSNGLRTENPVPGMLAMASAYKVTYDSLKVAVNASSDEQARREMGMKMGEVLTARHALLSEVIHTLQDNRNDTTEVTINRLMKEQAIDLPARSRLETGLAIHDSAFAAQALGEVAAQEGQDNYVKLYTILLRNMRKTPEQIMADPNILSQVQAMDADSSDKHAYLAANALLRSVGLSDYQPLYQEETNVDSTQERFLTTQNTFLQNGLFSKPNPFKESTTIQAVVTSKTDNAYVVITDMLGKEVGRYKVVQGDNVIAFNAADINQQVLFCTLVIDGVKIKTNKLVMIK